eukprot:GILJ01003840.1.p1 GENE.GILJ01003840.1~~GILJ01003840.1.p1  ORF type:complete len:238 (-),score=28.76 GILJ01003840.1:276-989(-)
MFPSDMSLFGPSRHNPFAMLERMSRMMDDEFSRRFDFMPAMTQTDMFRNMSATSSHVNSTHGPTFHSQTFIYSSTVGEDGRQHAEKYCQTRNGAIVNGRKMSEAQQSYSNSRTGIQKLGWERRLDSKARKVVKERNRDGEEICRDMRDNLEEDELEEFDRDWHGLTPSLPSSDLPSRRPALESDRYSSSTSDSGRSAYTSREAYRQSRRNRLAEEDAYDRDATRRRHGHDPTGGYYR